MISTQSDSFAYELLPYIFHCLEVDDPELTCEVLTIVVLNCSQLNYWTLSSSHRHRLFWLVLSTILCIQSILRMHSRFESLFHRSYLLCTISSFISKPPARFNQSPPILLLNCALSTSIYVRIVVCWCVERLLARCWLAMNPLVPPISPSSWFFWKLFSTMMYEMRERIILGFHSDHRPSLHS